jgi:hypothetical protein
VQAGRAPHRRHLQADRSPSPAKVYSPKSLATWLSVVSSAAAMRLVLEAHALYEDDLASVVVQRHDILDRHAVCGQTEFEGAGQRVVGRERVSKRWHRLLKQVREDTMHHLP